jgi:hypothetical protein
MLSILLLSITKPCANQTGIRLNIRGKIIPNQRRKKNHERTVGRKDASITQGVYGLVHVIV